MTGSQPVRPVGEEARKAFSARLASGFTQAYLSGKHILDIGYRGYRDDVVPIVDQAIGVELDYPGYDGITLPFPNRSQDAVFASHCLEHIDDFHQAFRDWHRVLRVGGFLIVMVPHQFLYERRTALPSRYNEDHKRFYTPASLLSEVEAALEPNSYRLRHLVDNDAGFDYAIPPERHAGGCYELELVLEKIEPPSWHLDESTGPWGCTETEEPAPVAAVPPAQVQLGAADTLVVVNDFSTSLPATPRIVVLKLDHLGDFIIGLPSLRQLREAFPAAFIRLVVGSWNRTTAIASGLVDEVVTYDFFPQVAKGWDGRPVARLEAFHAVTAGRWDLAVDLRVDDDTRGLLREVTATRRCGIAAPGRHPYLDIRLPPEHGIRHHVFSERVATTIPAQRFQSRMPFQHEFEHETDFRPVGGHSIYGPHIALPAGRFEARFALRLSSLAVGLRKTSINLDVTRDGSDTLVNHRIRGAGLRTMPRDGVCLPFLNDVPEARFEFRLFADGRPARGRLAFGGVRLRQLDAIEPSARFRPAELHIGEQLSLLVQLIADRTRALYTAPLRPARPAADGPLDIVIAPFSNSDLRDWPVQYYAELAGLLLNSRDVRIKLIGTAGQATALSGLASFIGADDRVQNLGGQTSWAELLPLLQKADLVIANNSGVAHAAASIGARTLAIYSASHPPQEWGPRGPASSAIWARLPCSPCGHDRLADCTNGHKCMKDLKPELIYKQVLRTIDAAG